MKLPRHSGHFYTREKGVALCHEHDYPILKNSGKNNELARNARSVVQLAKEFEPSEQTIHNWIQQADIDGSHHHDGASSEEKEELSRLRKENHRLQQERNILAKAAGWFAQETGSIPPKSSNS